MKYSLLLCTLLIGLILSTCTRELSDDSIYGADVNTWTFTEGSKVYKGTLCFDPILNTYLQANNSYTLAFIGEEKTSGYVFNVVLSLLDLNFAVKTYESGVMGTSYLNALYYNVSPPNLPNVYESSNMCVNPGAVITYRVSSYDASKDIVTITFSGKAFDKNGNLVNITDGKVTGRISRI